MSSRKKFKVNYSNVSCHSVRDRLESLVTHVSREHLVHTHKPRVHGLTDFHQRYRHKMHPSFFSSYWSAAIELHSRRNPSRAKLTSLFSSPDDLPLTICPFACRLNRSSIDENTCIAFHKVPYVFQYYVLSRTYFIPIRFQAN